MSEFDADDDFNAYEFNDEELAQAVALEEQFMSSQAAPATSAITDMPPHTDIASASPPPLAEPEPPVRAQQQRPSYRQPDPEPEIDNELARIVDDLRHKLFIQEHEKRDLERKLRDSQDMVKTKEFECLNLKRQIQTKATQPSTSTQSSKRAFPQTPPRPKSKIRKTATTPSQSLRPTSSFEISNAMESIHLSSQQQTSASTSYPPSTQSYTPSIKLEPLSVPDPRSITPLVSSTRDIRSALPPRPPSLASGPGVQQQAFNTQSSQANMNLLKLLFADILKETNKSRSTKLDMVLVPAQIRECARLFCLKLQPTGSACSRKAKEVLPLLASDIQEIIVRSENPRFTIPSLLTQFSMCLSICIEQSLHGIISTIVAVLKRLATFSALAVAQLVKEVKRDLTSSNVYKLVLALPLYDFQKPPSTYHVVEEFPSIVHDSSTDLILLGEKYSTTPHKIAEALEYKMPPPEAQDTVMCILSILTAVGAGYSKATLSFLFTDRNFLNLLSVSTPMQVLDKACAVLALSIRDKNFVELPWDACDEGVPLFGVSQLCKLLGSEEQDGNSSDTQWYSLWYRVCNLLRSATTLALPDGCATQTRKTILSSVVSFLVGTCGYDLSDKKADIIRHCKTVVKSASQALLATVKSLQDVKALDEDTVVTLRNLVIYYVDHKESHPAKASLLNVEKWLDQP